MKRSVTLASALLLASSMATAAVAQSSTPMASPSASPMASPSANRMSVDEVSKLVSSVDQGKLVDALKTPIPNTLLPVGYADAHYDNQGLSMVKIFEPETTVGYMVPYTPPASVAKVGDTAVRFGYINYQFFADPIDEGKLGELKSEIEQSIKDGGNEDMMKVADTEIQGQKAIEIISNQESDGKRDVSRIVIVPVGNVLVIENTTITGATDVNEPLMKQKSDDLTVSAIRYLGNVASKL